MKQEKKTFMQNQILQTHTKHTQLNMITKYFTKVSVRFNPFSPSAKPVRLFLARIPAQSKSGCAVDFKILENPADKATVKVTYKDKQTMEVDPENLTFKDLSSQFDTHSRKLALKEALSN